MSLHVPKRVTLKGLLNFDLLLVKVCSGVKLSQSSSTSAESNKQTSQSAGWKSGNVGIINTQNVLNGDPNIIRECNHLQ